MKATRAGSLFAIGFVLCATSSTLAQPADQQTTTVLHLSQTAERNVLRDLLRIDLRVEEAGADPLTIQSVINRRMAAALDRAHQVQGRRCGAEACRGIAIRWFVNVVHGVRSIA